MLLPNGWRVSPAGRALTLSTLPLNLVVSPDGKYAVITNNGLVKPSLAVVDVANWTVKSTFPLDHAWLGLVWHPDGTKIYSAGGGQNNVQELTVADGVLTRARTFALPGQAGETFAGGLAISRDGKTLFATRVFAMTLSSIDVASGQVTKTVTLPDEPYNAIVSPDNRIVYVSLWGGRQVRAYTTDSLLDLMAFDTGEHPNSMAVSADGRRLFVASASSAAVNVYDTFSGEALEQISTTLSTAAPRTTTPNALALSPDGRQLLVAVADLNALAVVDVSNPAHSFVDGFVPTGWYPTGVAYSRDGKQLLFLNGKGTPAADPLGGGMERRLTGSVSIVPAPDRVTLADMTRKVTALTPYTDAIRLSPLNIPVGSPIPRSVGAASPIKHVFYVIRENRTYDQILGDLTEGNGDPKLAIFGRDVTPNAHGLAQGFVVFDNFYVDADVSFDGHAFSTAAYATDVVQKLWQTLYANRGGLYLGEGGGAMRNRFGNLTSPEQGYIWDFATRAGISVRSYGEFVEHQSKSAITGDVVAVASVPGLKGLVASSYAGFDLDITDQKRLDNWLAEFREYEKNGNLPQLSVIHIPNDHTKGTTPGAPTPRAMIADNDLALGRLVDAISNSVYWRDSAIFVVEDDAQSGPDHVDSHRSVLLVASPFAKRGFVDHSFYTTSGVLRTIELILGLEPMSQYDAAATPLYNAFVGTPNMATYQRMMPRVALDEKNLASAFGAMESLAMNFNDEDRTPEILLNEIIWRSVKGPHVPMPPPRRSVFVRPLGTADH